MSEPMLTQEECEDLARIMGIKYAAQLKGRQFVIAVQNDAELVEAVVTLHNADNSFYYPVTGRLSHRQQNIAVDAATFLLLDYIDAYFEEFLREEENVFLPLDWGQFQCEGIDLELKGQVQNLKCEQMADQWLAGEV